MDRNGNEISNAVLDLDTRVIPEPKSIERDSYLNVKSFLSSHTPLGLVRNSSKEGDTDGIVGFDILDGKVVMICCFSLPLPTTDSDIAMAMSYVSSELHAFGAFELVIVVNMRDVNHSQNHVSLFNDFISALPSFALLVHYLNSDGICAFLNFVPGSDPLGVLVNRNHLVEWHKSLNFFLQYGADAYPFTTERLSVINEMESIPGKRLSRPSFMLSSRTLPYPKYTSKIRKNPGGGPGKKSIDGFDSRPIVCLYLCYTGNLIPTLAEVDKNCSDKGLGLEIILVYMPFKDFSDPQSFQDRINSALEEGKVSWWVFPFVYWVSRRLWRLFHRVTEDKLIMIDARDGLVEPHGEAVVRHFGIDAYPFCRERLLQRELKKLWELTLEELLVHNSRDYVLGTNGHIVPLKALQGKNVLLYLGYLGPHLDKFIVELLLYSRDRKACEPYFEMVFVGLNASSFHGFKSLCEKSWLVCPFEPEHSEFVSKKIFREGDRCSTLVAFGKNGHICSVHAQQALSSSCPNFFEYNLRSEMIDELFGSRQLPVCCL